MSVYVDQYQCAAQKYKLLLTFTFFKPCDFYSEPCKAYAGCARVTIASSGSTVTRRTPCCFSATASSPRCCILSENRARCEVKARYRDHASCHEPPRGYTRSPSHFDLDVFLAVTYERFTCLTEVRSWRSRLNINLTLYLALVSWTH